jgi:sugar transferase (PEP-CTERM/EpsH1 system associated)
MRILWLNSNLLLPLDKGGKLRTWHLLRQLGASHAITYVAFEAPGHPPADREGMREVCGEIVTIPRAEPPRKDSARFLADALTYLPDPMPYAVGKYRSPAYAGAVRALLARTRFDLVVCDFLVPAINMPLDLPCPSVLFTHNVEAEIWRRHAETQPSALRRRLFATQWARMRRFEERTLGRFDLVLAVSEADRATFERLYPGTVQQPIHVVPTGVDTCYFSPPPPPPADPPRLVFTGSMDWIPNEDAVVSFARDIFPRIRAVVPDVVFAIVGRAPGTRVRALAVEAGIEVTGRVDDVRPEIAAAGVYVVPLRIGGGTRLKIFEAMAMGKAVVSTTVGAEGLPVTDGRDILLRDDPGRFADAVVELLGDDARRLEIGNAARTLVADRYDWSVVARDLEAALLGVVRGAGSRRHAAA